MPSTGGRRKVIIDLDRVRQAAALHLAEHVIAALCGVSKDTFSDRKAESPELRQALEEGRANGKLSLATNINRLAETDAKAAIFMAKNWLGMVDKKEVAVSEASKLSNEELIERAKQTIESLGGTWKK